jgi:hypothetical protein
MVNESNQKITMAKRQKITASGEIPTVIFSHR